MNRHDLSDKHIKRQQMANREKANISRVKNIEKQLVSEEKEEEPLCDVDYPEKKLSQKANPDKR